MPLPDQKDLNRKLSRGFQASGDLSFCLQTVTFSQILGTVCSWLALPFDALDPLNHPSKRPPWTVLDGRRRYLADVELACFPANLLYCTV